MSVGTQCTMRLGASEFRRPAGTVEALRFPPAARSMGPACHDIATTIQTGVQVGIRPPGDAD